MASSEVEICNIALSLLAVEPITSLDDKTTEARLCKANYANVRDAVLEDADWTFAMVRGTPAKLSDPVPWGYTAAFQRPSGCLRVTVVKQSDSGDPDRSDRINWQLEKTHIVANADKIYIKYVERVTDVTLFSPMFVQALAQRLAAELAIPLTESNALHTKYWELYVMKRDEAASVDGMQGVQPSAEANRLIRVR